jgi:hypothetical protein
MSRLAIFVLPLAVVSLAAAPLPKARDKAAPFVMTKEGDTKVSEIRADGSVSEVIEVVSKVEKKGDTVRVTVSRQLKGRAQAEATFEASPKGVFLVAAAGKDLADPRPYLRLPAKEGDTWTWSEEAPPAKHTWTAAKWEDVEVPAGKFQALRVEARLDSPGAPTRTGTYWFAPGMGVIKSVLNTGPGEQTTVLTSFKPGK